MGPQLYRCGNLVYFHGAHDKYKGFNGAATLSLRKFLRCCPGPPLRMTCFNGAATLSLRKFATAFRDGERRVRFNGAATLSLRKFDAVIVSLRKYVSASMGPQLYRCGNGIDGLILLLTASSLQWGRNFIVAEISDKAKDNIRWHTLQWGRNFIVAEMYHTYAAYHEDRSRFNGAATLSLRKWQTGT